MTSLKPKGRFDEDFSIGCYLRIARRAALPWLIQSRGMSLRSNRSAIWFRPDPALPFNRSAKAYDSEAGAVSTFF